MSFFGGDFFKLLVHNHIQYICVTFGPIYDLFLGQLLNNYRKKGIYNDVHVTLTLLSNMTMLGVDQSRCQEWIICNYESILKKQWHVKQVIIIMINWIFYNIIFNIK